MEGLSSWVKRPRMGSPQMGSPRMGSVRLGSCMTSNFRRSYLSRPNSDSSVLRLHGKPIESRFHPDSCGEHWVPELARKGLLGKSGRLSG